MEAVTSVNPVVNGSFMDVSQSTFATIDVSGIAITANGKIPVTVVGAPVAGNSRQIKTLNIYNPDTVAHNVYVAVSGGAIGYPVYKAYLSSNQTATYEDHYGWTISPASLTSVYTPTVQSFLGSGAQTYTTPTNPIPLYINIEALGGGAGGNGNNDAGTGGNGSNTTFGTNFIIASGCPGSSATTFGGTFVATNPNLIKVIAVNGATGSLGGFNSGTTAIFTAGGDGGSSFYGGGGSGGTQGGAGAAAIVPGAGGGGGSDSNATNTRASSGGGAGGYIKAILTAPSGSYPIAVGGFGAGNGTANAGGNGDTGLIIVTEYYQ